MTEVLEEPLPHPSEERNLVGFEDGNAVFLRKSVNFPQTTRHHIPETELL
jgi:hypothetical protein